MVKFDNLSSKFHSQIRNIIKIGPVVNEKINSDLFDDKTRID